MTALTKPFAGYDKIKGLIYTEKSNKQLADGNKYSFEVDSSVDKKEVAYNLESIACVYLFKSIKD